VADELRDEVFAQQADGTAVNRLGGVAMTVTDAARNTAEEVPGHNPATVVRDAPDLDRRRVTDGLDHLYVVEEEVHGYG
jgi:hypothetical protein